MKLIIDIDEKKYEEIKRIAKAQFELTDKTEAQIIANGTPYEERSQGELKEYKPFEVDYNVKSAVENLKTAYWSNDTEKYAKAFTEADQMIVSAICHYGYIVVKGGEEE